MVRRDSECTLVWLTLIVADDSECRHRFSVIDVCLTWFVRPTDSVIVPPVPPEDPPEPQEAPEEQEPPEEVAELRVSMSSDTAEPVEPPASVSLETSEVGELEVLALSDASETIGSHPSASLESVEVAVELQEPASPEGAEAQAPPMDSTSNDAAAAVMNPSEDNHPMEDARYVSSMFLVGAFMTYSML